MNGPYKGQPFVVEDIREGSTVEIITTFCTSEAEAIAEARDQWSTLSKEDRNPRKGSRYIDVSAAEPFEDDPEEYVTVGCIFHIDRECEIHYGRSATTEATVSRTGNSLGINMTQALIALGVSRGDTVRVTVERLE